MRGGQERQGAARGSGSLAGHCCGSSGLGPLPGRPGGSGSPAGPAWGLGGSGHCQGGLGRRSGSLAEPLPGCGGWPGSPKRFAPG